MANIHRGKRFERFVASFFSKLTGEKWVRTPQSGAYSTIHNSFKNLQADIICKSSPEKYNFAVECKIRKWTLELEHFINPKSELRKWINKLGKDFIIVFKKDRQHTIYLISDKKEHLESLTLSSYKIADLYFSVLKQKDIK